MPHPIEPSTLHILKPTGETVGTGFLVSKNLAVTCAHVVKILGAGAGDTIDIRFTGKSVAITARVLPEYWRPDESTDIAILHVDDVPTGVFPLRIGRASESRLKNDLYTFGYAIAGGEQGIGGLGTFITLNQEGNFIQFRMHEANHGHSGAPIYDDKRGVVVGMIKKGTENLGRNAETTFAIPTETLWQVCPQLKPPTPILPRRNPIVEGINLLPYDYDQRIQNFLTEYLGTESHPVPFGGRDEALKMLDTWLAETTPYLLLAAPAGRGKSALLVRWLDNLKEREDLALAFVPVSIRFGTNMERVFYAALAARLAFLHGDDVPASPETSTAVYRGLVSDYLSKPLANGRTLLVVLDGLDEAADWQAGADFMPGELPAGVRMVVSARFLAGDADSTPWLRCLNWERNGLAAAPPLTSLDQEGVRDVLFKMGYPLDELSGQVDIVAELHRLSAGDPLLVNFYVYDLWRQKEKAPRLKSEELKKLKPGYDEYFKKWWKDQKALWGEKAPLKVKTTKLVFNLLCGAMGALTIDDLIALDTRDELDSFAIEDAIETLDRFVISVTIDDRTTQTGYVITHPKFRDYFWEKLSEKERNQIEKRFLIWGERTFKEFVNGKRNPKDKGEVPFYAVRNYSAHLARAKQPIEKWLRLIHHQQWAQAWFTVEGAYGGYLQDIQRVWEKSQLLDRQAIETDDKAPFVGQQIRCALIKSSLHSLAGNIPTGLIWPLVSNRIWTLPQVWVVIRQISDAEQQVNTILALIPHLDEQNLITSLVVVQEIKHERLRADVLSALVHYLPKEALWQVVVAAHRIESNWDRARVLSALAKRLPEVTEEALDAARMIQNKEYRAEALSELAQCLPEVAEEALKVMWTIQNGESLAHVLRRLAHNLPEGELGQVLTGARMIWDEGDRADVLSVLAERLPKAAEEALNAASRMQYDFEEEYRANLFGNDVRHSLDREEKKKKHDRVLRNLAHRLPEGALWQVLELLRRMLIWRMQNEGERSCSNVLRELAQRMPKEELMLVLNIVREMKEEGYRAHVLIALAQRLPGVADEALAAVRAIKSERNRADALCKLAQYLPEVAGEALEAIRTIRFGGDRARLLTELAQQMPEVTEEALEATRTIQDEGFCARILGELSHHHPEAVGKALEVARAIQFEGYRASVLSELTQRLSEGSLEQVLEATQTIQSEKPRAHVLSALVQRIPEGALGQILEMARAIQDERCRASVLEKLTQRLPEGALGPILEMARAIQDEGSRVSVLEELAQRMPEGELGQVLEATWAIKFDWSRASVLSAVAQRLPEEELGRVLEAARMIEPEKCTNVLLKLAQRLPEGMLEQILEMTQAIQDERRAGVLIELAKRLPEAVDGALETALLIRNSEVRARALSSLVQHLPGGALGPILEMARAIQDEGSRVSVLEELAQCMPKEELGQVLEATWVIKSDWSRASVLSAVAQRLPEEELGRVLEAARMTQDKKYRARVLGILAQRLPEVADEALEIMRTIQIERERANLLKFLSQCLPERALGQVLAMARTIQDERYRSMVLTDLAQRVSENVLGQVLEAAQMIRFEGYRAEVLKALVLRLPEVAKEALEVARAIRVEEVRARMLVSLAQCLPDAAGEALGAILTMRDEGNRVDVLNRLSQCQSESLWESMVAIPTIHNKDSRTEVLKSLTQSLLIIYPPNFYEKLEITIIECSHGKRSELFSDLTSIMPILVHLGTDDTPREIYEAVRDVTAWWP